MQFSLATAVSLLAAVQTASAWQSKSMKTPNPLDPNLHDHQHSPSTSKTLG